MLYLNFTKSHASHVRLVSVGGANVADNCFIRIDEGYGESVLALQTALSPFDVHGCILALSRRSAW